MYLIIVCILEVYDFIFSRCLIGFFLPNSSYLCTISVCIHFLYVDGVSLCQRCSWYFVHDSWIPLSLFLPLCFFRSLIATLRIYYFFPLHFSMQIPIVVSYLGFAATTGAPFVDFVITDAVASPPDTFEEAYSEAAVYLPSCYHSFGHRERERRSPSFSAEDKAIVFERLSSVSWQSEDRGEGREVFKAFGLAESKREREIVTVIAHFRRRGGVVFGVFSRAFKITARRVELWSRLLCLSSKPSLLLISGIGVGEAAQRRIRQRVSSLLQNCPSILPSQLLFPVDREVSNNRTSLDSRVVFLPALPKKSHLVLKSVLVDVVLDTSPYGAHVTAADALFFGVPVVTFPVEATASRVSSSMLTELSKPSPITADGSCSAIAETLIARSERDYREKAIAVAEDAALRERLTTLLQRCLPHSNLFDLREKVEEISRAAALMKELRQVGDYGRFHLIVT